MMMNNPKKLLHSRPFFVAGLMLAAAIVLIILCVLRRDDPGMNGYAFGAFGLMLFIVSVITFLMYGRLEEQYQHLVREEPLLRYTLGDEHSKQQRERNITELKSKNKALLMVMLFFCVLFAIILPFFVEEKLLMVAICLGLGAFLTLSAWSITAYRVRKLRRGGEEVILGLGGAFLEGTFHSWDVPGAGLSDLSWKPPAGIDGLGELRMEYTVEGTRIPQSESILLLIPPNLQGEVPRVLEELEKVRHEWS